MACIINEIKLKKRRFNSSKEMNRTLYLFCVAVATIHSLLIELVYGLRYDMWFSGCPYVYYVRTICIAFSVPLLILTSVNFWTRKSECITLFYYTLCYTLYSGSAIYTYFYAQFQSEFTYPITIDLTTCVLSLLSLYGVVVYKLDCIDFLRSDENEMLLP